MHIDEEFAKTTPFRKRICHGFGVFSMASGLGVSIPPVRTIALFSVRNWSFLLAGVHRRHDQGSRAR